MTAAAVGEIAARQGIASHELRPMTHSLEDVFLPVLQAGEETVMARALKEELLKLITTRAICGCSPARSVSSC
jgi:hypothetical protein